MTQNKNFDAVILFHHPVMDLYENDKIVCSSNNGITGITADENICHRCIDCIYNQFGSGENGSKKCKTKRKLYLYKDNKTEALILHNLEAFGKYIMGIVLNHQKSSNILTHFEYMDGDYVFMKKRDLTLDEQNKMNDLIGKLKQCYEKNIL